MNLASAGVDADRRRVRAGVVRMVAASAVALAGAVFSSAAAAQSQAAQAGDLSIRFQQTARAKDSGLQLHFSGYRDARCPADVVCISGGSAVAFFWLTGPDIQPQALSLPIGDLAGRQRPVRVGPYEFVLRALEPRRRVRMQVSPDEYSAVVALRLQLPAGHP